MQLSRRLTQVGSLTKLFSKVMPNLAYIIVLIALVGQCTSNNSMRQSLLELQRRPLVTQIGKDKRVVIAEPLTEEQARTEFVRDLLPKAFAWTRNTPTDYQRRCKALAQQKQDRTMFQRCESGIDPGVRVPNIGVFTSQIYVYQNGIAPENRNAIMQFIYSQRKSDRVDFDKGDSRLLSVDGVGKSEKVGGEWKTPCVLTFHEYNKSGVLVGRVTFDSWVYTRPTLPMIPNGNQTPLNEALAATLMRGHYLTRILPMEVQQR
jgi:hypothetical protein